MWKLCLEENLSIKVELQIKVLNPFFELGPYNPVHETIFGMELLKFCKSKPSATVVEGVMRVYEEPN